MSPRTWIPIGLLVLCGVMPASAAAAASPAEHLGVVDPARFIELAGGPDAVKVELSVHQSMLKLLCAGLDKELGQVACGLESISAVVIGAQGDTVARAAKLMASTEQTLKSQGWERMALVKDEDSEVHVLVLNDDNAVRGLVVMVLDRDEGELVFANLAGTIDLQKIKAISEELDIPGLDSLGEIK